MAKVAFDGKRGGGGVEGEGRDRDGGRGRSDGKDGDEWGGEMSAREG